MSMTLKQIHKMVVTANDLFLDRGITREQRNAIVQRAVVLLTQGGWTWDDLAALDGQAQK